MREHPLPVALKILLQLAERNIRQLTDIEPARVRRGVDTCLPGRRTGNGLLMAMRVVRRHRAASRAKMSLVS